MQYLTQKVDHPGDTVGHASVMKERGGAEFNPDFVFTDVMNGCAWTVSQDEKDERRFDAWHFQSPGSNKAAA